MNSKKLKMALIVGAAAGSFVAAMPAIAQESGFSDTDAIIVTARRVEENLQDVPISITVYSQEDITKRNITNPTDLANYTPSLSVNQIFGAEKASYAMRGFTQDQNTAPTVGVYFADVIGVRAQAGFTAGNTQPAGTFTDLENVQVLKGPQGTLFGRNTTGGAILLVPTKPKDTFGGNIEATYGNLDQMRLQGAINVPLADTFKVRLAFDRNKRDGYIKNKALTGPRDFFDVNYTYLRLGVLAELTPDLENYTIAHYSNSDTNGHAARIDFCDRAYANNPNIPSYFQLPTGPFPNLKKAEAVGGCAQMDRATANGWGKFTTDSSQDAYLKMKIFQIINTTTWQASDTLTVKNIMSYGQIEARNAFDVFSTNFTVPASFAPGPGIPGQPFSIVTAFEQAPYNDADSRTFTEELQLQGRSADGKLDYVAGGYLEFSRPLGWQQYRSAQFADCTSQTLAGCRATLGIGFVLEQRDKYAFDNHGVFAQATYHFSDRLALTLGGRWTFDKIVGRFEGARYTLANVPGLGSIPVSLTCYDVVRHAGVNILASNDRSKCNTTLTEKSNKPTWLVQLDYKPTEDLMVYGKWARGYRQGGMSFVNPGLEVWGPEAVDAYELGAKATLRGAVSGYFNAALFYNDLKDQQLQFVSIPNPTSGLSAGNVVANGGTSKTYGLEIDAALRFFDVLRITAGYTYLKTKLESLDPPTVQYPFDLLQPQAVIGAELAFSPKHRLTTTATVTLPVDESVGNVSFGATYTYTAKQVQNAAALLGTLPARGLVNLNLDWEHVGGSDFDISLFGTNIFNKAYAVSEVGLGANANDPVNAFETLYYGPSRMYGVRLKYTFGE